MAKKVRPDLVLYQDPQYFVGNGISNGYRDYADCEGLLRRWTEMAVNAAALSNPPVMRTWLDVGAAYGFVVREAFDMGMESVGIDPSQFAIDQAHPDMDMRLGALPDLPLKKGERFDMVTCTEVLEHVPEELTPASLKSLADAMSPNGRMVLLIMLEGPGSDGDPGHINLHSRAWWDAQLGVAGLETCPDATAALNEDEFSVEMHWAGRLWVLRHA